MELFVQPYKSPEVNEAVKSPKAYIQKSAFIYDWMYQKKRSHYISKRLTFSSEYQTKW